MSSIEMESQEHNTAVVAKSPQKYVVAIGAMSGIPNSFWNHLKLKSWWLSPLRSAQIIIAQSRPHAHQIHKALYWTISVLVPAYKQFNFFSIHCSLIQDWTHFNLAIKEFILLPSDVRTDERDVRSDVRTNEGEGRANGGLVIQLGLRRKILGKKPSRFMATPPKPLIQCLVARVTQ